MSTPRLNRSLTLTLLLALTMAPSFAGAQEKDQTPPSLSEKELQNVEQALPDSAAVKPKKDRRVLVFWRCEGFFHGHGIAVGNKAIEMMGKKTGAYSVDITDEYSAFEKDNLAKYDAVILNNTTHLKLSRRRQEEPVGICERRQGTGWHSRRIGQLLRLA